MSSSVNPTVYACVCVCVHLLIINLSGRVKKRLYKFMAFYGYQAKKKKNLWPKTDPV